MISKRDRKNLTDRYLDLYQMAYDFLRVPTEAEDAVQEALARTLARPWLKDPYNYCCRVLRNYCVDALRENCRMVSIEEVDAYVADESLSGTSIETIAWSQKEGLPPILRRIVDLHDIEGKSLEDVAEIMGMSTSNVKKLILVAHSQLRLRIQERMKDIE